MEDNRRSASEKFEDTKETLTNIIVGIYHESFNKKETQNDLIKLVQHDFKDTFNSSSSKNNFTDKLNRLRFNEYIQLLNLILKKDTKGNYDKAIPSPTDENKSDLLFYIKKSEEHLNYDIEIYEKLMISGEKALYQYKKNEDKKILKFISDIKDILS